VAGARWTTLAVVAALALGAIAVAGCGSSEKGVDVRKVALVAPFGDNDPDWTLQAKEVVEEFPRSLHVRADVADASQTDDVRAALEQVSHEGDQLVIAHDSRYADAAEAVAQETKVPELVWGERKDPPAGLVGQITVQDKEGGYLAGVAAAHSAITRRLGVVVTADGSDWDLATWNRTAGGFVAGAHSVDPRVSVRYAQVGGDGDATAAQARAAAKRMLAEGVQTILELGGNAALGAQRAVEATKGRDETLSIGVVSDKSSTRRLEAGGVPIMLGSVMWETRPAFRRAIADLRAGTFGDRPYALTLANRGVWLYQTGRMPRDAYEAAMAAAAKIEEGALDVPATPTREAVEQLIGSGSR
jgi:basic membrane protein A and related proteins